MQRQVIDLLRDLQEAHGLSYIFISHDLAVIKAMSDYVVVMKNGKIVEEGATEEIFKLPARGLYQDADGSGAGYQPVPPEREPF